MGKLLETDSIMSNEQISSGKKKIYTRHDKLENIIKNKI